MITKERNFFIFTFDMFSMFLGAFFPYYDQDIFQHQKPYLSVEGVLYLSKKIKKDAKKEMNK